MCECSNVVFIWPFSMYFSGIFSGSHIYVQDCSNEAVIVNVLPMCTNMLPVKLILFSELLENSRAVLTVRTGRGRKWWKSLKRIGWLIKKYIKETHSLYMFTKPRYSKNTGEEGFTNMHINSAKTKQYFSCIYYLRVNSIKKWL